MPHGKKFSKMGVSPIGSTALKFLLVSILLLILIGSAHASLTDNLISYYKLDETTGTTANDSTATENDGTITGATINQKGLLNKAYDFRAEPSFIALGTEITPVSISFWIKPDSASNYGLFSNNANSIIIQTTVTGKIDFYSSSSHLSDATLTGASWQHFAFVYSSGGYLVYKNGTYVDKVTVGQFAIKNIVRASPDFAGLDGLIDEVGFWNRILTADEITELYNSGSGLTYPFGVNAVFADFDYVVTGTQVDLNDTSTVGGDAVIDSWEWLIDDLSVSTDQNYLFTGTESTDYNVCLIIQDTTLSLEDSTCQTISISDLTPPTTSFESNQITGSTDQNIVLTCDDGTGDGCKTINFRINNGDWNYYTIGDNPLNIIYSGAGDHNIQFYSTDNADNTETTKLSYFPMFKSENEPSNSRIKLTGVTNYNGYTITSWLYQVNGTPLSGTTDRIKYYSTQSNQDLNVCLTTNNTDTICQNVFTWDTINPTIDANIKTSGYGFTNTFDINYNLTCNDNFPFITYKVIWANNGTTITLDEQYLATKTLLQGTLDLNAGQEATLTFTCTDASNNQATYTTPTQYAIQFNIVDETTSLPFDLTKVTHAQAYTYDGNYLFNFKDTNNATQTYWSPTSVIRFDFTYPDEAQTKISREINFDYIDDANVPVCAAEYQQFYLYRFLSTTEKPIILYNDFANCYSLASTTKFLWTTYLTNTAYTINKPYYLYTYSNGVKSLLAILDGANNTEINLDILQFNQAQYQFDVASDSIVFRPGENDSNTIVFYFFSPNNNTWVNLEIYDQANNLLWDYLENTDTNSFQVTFFYGDLDINSDDLLKIVVTVLNDGDTTTFFKYFNTKGEAYAGLLNPIVAIVLSFFVLFFGITMVSYRFAMGWFGIVISFLAIGILALAPLYDYVLFLMAIYFIIGLFIGLIGKEQTLGVN